MAHRARLSNRQVVHLALALSVVFTGALAGCDCGGGGGLGEVEPNIVARPAEVVFDRVAAGTEHTQQLLIENDGSLELVIDGDPVLVENGEDGETEIILRAVMVPVNCGSGEERVDETPYGIAPGECVSVTVVYFPQNLGADTGTITIASNDPDTPELVVPINALGAAPDIEVCVLQSDCSATTVCNDAGPLVMDFPLTQINDTRTCPVRISNTGELTLENLAWSFKSGNRRRDYVLAPEDLSTLGPLAPGAGVELDIEFTPRSGGPKDALVEVTSNDFDESAVTIRIDGMGDGPKVCPDPFPLIDFGRVEVGTTDSLDVTLTNCGTLELSVTAIEIQNSSGTGPSNEFALGAGSPAPPVALAPSASTAVPVEFTPPTVGYFTGRLYLESTDPVVPSGWVNVVGEGIVPPSCQLQASTSTVSFGTAAPTSLGGMPVEKTLALSNPGELPCTAVSAEITAGAAIAFNIVGFPAGGPPWVLQPGEIVVFTLQYDPADTTGPDTGTITFDSADVAAPLEVTLTGTPVDAPTCDLLVTPKKGNFSFNECAIFGGFTPRVAQFGAVKMGQDKTIPVTLENIGSIACTITGVSLKPVDPITGIDSTFDLVTGNNRVSVGGNLTTTINPGEVGEVQVRYQPVNEEQNCGAMWVETTSPLPDPTECNSFSFPPQTGGPGCYMVTFVGQGVRSAIEVIPSELDFGVITVGCASQDREVTIYNIGQAPMNLTNIYVDPTGSPFSITSAPPVPVAVPGGGSITVRLRYRPPDANNHSALLVLESDAQNASYLTVPLLGKGTNDPHQQDVFQQLSEPMVDVLWVVDDSCSMSEEQNNIANNAGTFLSRALSLSTDFQIGVVTTDMEDPNKSGKLQSRNGAPKIITRTAADPVGAFRDNVRQGTSGDATEKGLDATHSALSDPLINDPAFNQGFLRDDAKLVVIAVSDEEDASTPPVDFFIDFLKNIKGYRNSDLMSFSAVVGYDEGSNQAASCTSSDGDAIAGTRYVEVANRTGGLSRSICSGNWGQIADDLGLDAFGAKSQFFLTREPIPATIEVRVDGVLVSQAGNWTYEAASNSIIFEPTAVPAQGVEVIVDYDTICR